MKQIIILSLALITLSAFADTSEKCPGEDGYYYTNYRSTSNPTAGGFVAHTATIENSQSIVIGRAAAVCGDAIVLDSANISGSAIVRGNAEVSGSAIITGSVTLEGDVRVGGNSVIKGSGSLSSGTYNNVQKTVSQSSSPSSPSSSSPYDIAVKIKDYVSRNASRLSPTDGNLYEPGDTLDQSVSFSDGGCSITIKKYRKSATYSSSAFYIDSSVTVNMREVTEVKYWEYGPSWVIAYLQANNPEEKVNGFYKFPKKWRVVHSDSSSYRYDWGVARWAKWNDKTVESIETSSKIHGSMIRDLLKQLKSACP